jgi:hypothetical protein
LLSFVSLLLLLSLLLTLLEVEAPAPDDVDEDGVGSFLMMFVGGDPSSCFIDVTTSCSVEPKKINFEDQRITCFKVLHTLLNDFLLYANYIFIRTAVTRATAAFAGV